MNEPGNVSDLFFAAAEKWPGKIALVDRDGSTLTFVGLAVQVEATAAYYRSKGIGKGDRVLVFVPMGIPLYRCILALFRIGAVAVFLDEWVSKERLEVCCRLAKCKAFIAPLKLRAMALLSKEMRHIPIWLGTSLKTTNNKQRTTNDKRLTTNDTALITFTTGSTGIPKAADRTHGYLTAQFTALVDKIRPKESDIDMPVLPIVLLLNLGTGVTSVIADYNSRKPETLDTEKIWAQVRKWKCNRITASPYVIEKLAEDRTHRVDADGMRIFTGGAPVFPDQAKKMSEGFRGASIQIVYGSTEAEPISSIFADELARRENELERGLPVGKPYHGTSVRILPVTNEAITATSESALQQLALPAEQVGEIVVSGDHVLRHYIDNPEAEQLNKIFIGDNVWHRTGDAGFTGKNGELYLCGRSSTLIRDANGKLLAPFLWEGWFRSVHGVSAGTVLQREDMILAVLEVKVNADRDAISATVNARYPFSKLIFVERIPRDPRHFSKIDYGKLGEMMNASLST